MIAVYHAYDEDGGFGDSVSVTELVAIFESDADADAFVKKYSRVVITNDPYCFLTAGYLYTERIEKFIKHEDFNLEKKPAEYGAYFPSFDISEDIEMNREKYKEYKSLGLANEDCDCKSNKLEYEKLKEDYNKTAILWGDTPAE